MRNTKLLIATAGLATLALAPIAHAADDSAFGLDIAGKISTLGAGGELGYRFSDYLAVRAGYNGGTLKMKDKTNPTNNFTLSLKTAPIVLDVHPFGGIFRVSAGYVNNQNEATTVETGTVTVGGNNYNTTATTTVNYGTSAYYVGLGWAALPSTKSGFGFSFDLGAMHQGAPNVTMTAPGVPQSDINKQIDTYKKDLEFKYWPVIAFGVGYTF